MSIKVEKIKKELIGCCASCNASNHSYPFVPRVTEELYFIQFGSSGITLCSDCLAELEEKL